MATQESRCGRGFEEGKGANTKDMNKQKDEETVKKQLPLNLFKFPDDILQTILEFAVTEDESIKPFQIRKKSNKFGWNPSQRIAMNDGTSSTKFVVEISNAPQLTAVQLSSVSKKMYALVANNHMLYRQNKFEFGTEEDLKIYLAAITKIRREQIGNMEVQLLPTFDTYQRDSSDAFALLSTCKNLKALEIAIHSPYHDPTDIDPWCLSGIKELVAAVRGVKSIVCKVSPAATQPSYLDGIGMTAGVRFAKAEKLREILAPFLQLEAKQKRGDVSQLLINKAIENAGLDVDGELRLAEDRKPAIYTRTRQKRALEKDIDKDGVLPARKQPKLSADGNLTCKTLLIRDVREISDELFPVEFLVMCSNSDQCWMSWESIGVLDTARDRQMIVDFYERNLDACGMELVKEIWELSGGLTGNRKDPEVVAKRRDLMYLRISMRRKILADEKAEKADAIRRAIESSDAKKKRTATTKNAGATPKKATAAKLAGRKGKSPPS